MPSQGAGPRLECYPGRLQVDAERVPELVGASKLCYESFAHPVTRQDIAMHAFRLALAILIVWSAPVEAALWSGIIDPERAADWRNAGVAGGIPNRTAICQTLSPGASAAQINSAIAACPANQVVFLNAGTYNLTAGLIFNGKSNVTLRGAGPNQTFLKFSGTVGCVVGGTDLCITDGYSLYPLNPGGSASWSAGYSQGTTSVTLSNTNGLAVGDIMVLDQLDDSNTDTGNIWICSTQDVCSSEGDSGVRRPEQRVRARWSW